MTVPPDRTQPPLHAMAMSLAEDPEMPQRVREFAACVLDRVRVPDAFPPCPKCGHIGEHYCSASTVPPDAPSEPVAWLVERSAWPDRPLLLATRKAADEWRAVSGCTVIDLYPASSALPVEGDAPLGEQTIKPAEGFEVWTANGAFWGYRRTSESAYREAADIGGEVVELVKRPAASAGGGTAVDPLSVDCHRLCSLTKDGTHVTACPNHDEATCTRPSCAARRAAATDGGA